MKKVSLICLTVLMIVALVVPAFAASGAFVSSPSANNAPVVESFTPDHEDCKATIVITAYGDRDQLSEEARALLEKAYNAIATKDAAFVAILADLAKQLKLDASDLAISDLFDIDTSLCEDHDGHGGFTITLKIANIDKFVGMLHLQQSEKWEICDIRKTDKDAGTITFHGTEFSPFALVITTGEMPEPVNNLWWIILIIIAVIAIAIVVWFVFFKKKKDDDEAEKAAAAAQNADAQ